MFVRLNLASKPLISQRRFLAASALLGVTGLILFGILGWRFYTLRKADQDLRAKTGKIQQEMSQLLGQRKELERFFAQEENANLQDRARFVTSIIEARSFNWTEMFMDLEQILPAGVHVLRVEPKLEKGTVTVKFMIGATNDDSKLKLLKAFEESRSFTHVELLSASALKQPGSDPVTVEFTAVYTGI